MENQSSSGKILGAIIIIFAIAAGAWYFTKDDVSTTKTDTATENAVPVVTGDETLLETCAPGTFKGQDGKNSIYVTVLEKTSDEQCKIESAQEIAQLALFNPEPFDRDGDGFLRMTCLVPNDIITDFAILTGYLQGSELMDCEGEMKNFTMDLSAKLK